MSTIASEAEARTSLGLMTSITDEERAMLNLLLPEAEGAVISHLGYDPVQRSETEYYPRADPSGGIGIVGAAWDVDAAHRQAELYGIRGRAPMFPSLQLERIPVRQVTDLRIDYAARFGQASGSFATASKKTAGTDFWLETDKANFCPTGCLFANFQWPMEPGTVRVTYRAGYSPDELAGRATTSSVAGDGTITTARVNASPIKRAVLLTLSTAMQKWAALKKSKTGWKPGGLSSEKLGDYSYTVGGTSAETIAGLKVELPGTAIEILEPFRHYGLMRL